MRRSRFIPLVFMAFVILACAHAPSRQVVFLLEPPLGSLPCQGHIPLAILPLEASPPFGGALMAYSQSLLEVEFYAYHRWAGPLPELITDAMVQAFQRWGCVTLVSPSPQVYVLRGRIIRFLHSFEGGASWGEVTLNFSLEHGRETLEERTFTSRIRARSDTPQGGAQALNRALGRVFTQLMLWLGEIWKVTEDE